MLIVVASVSGAPGVSTVSLGLAALWPRRPALLVEADPAGGVVAARFAMAQEPGLASLAAAARHGGRVAGPAPFVQQLPLGLHVVVGPGSAETAAGAVAVLAAHAATAVAGLAPVVVADAGRLYGGSPAVGLLEVADAVVLLTHPHTEHLDHLDIRLPALIAGARRGRVGVAVAGKGAYPPEEIRDWLGVPVWAELPSDRWGAGALTGRLTGWAWTRTRLAQACRTLAGELAARSTAALDEPAEVLA